MWSLGKLERIPLVAFYRLWGWQRWLVSDSVSRSDTCASSETVLSKITVTLTRHVKGCTVKYSKLIAFQELISTPGTHPKRSFLTNRWTLPMRYRRLGASRSSQVTFSFSKCLFFTNFSRWSQCCPCWEQCPVFCWDDERFNRISLRWLKDVLWL